MLRVEVNSSALIHWSDDDWQTAYTDPTNDTTLGIHCLDLAAADLTVGRGVRFTFYWLETKQWEGVDFAVDVTQ
jgi:glucoamylase